MTLARQLTIAATTAKLPRKSPAAIYVVVSDDHNTHCLNESMLDAWFTSLSPEHKAEIYERDMESDILDHAPAALGLAPILRQAEDALARCVSLSNATLTRTPEDALYAHL